MARTALTLFLLAASALVATACHNDRQAGGPLERAGRGVDTAAQKTGEALERAGSATGKAFKGAGSDLGVRGTPDKKTSAKPPSEPSKPGPEEPKSPADE